MFQDAEREQLYAKIVLFAASGAGKTVSALKLAYGITGDWQKIGIADTENKRALAYVGTSHTGITIGKFKHAPMHAPYSTEKFEQAIDIAIDMGLEVLIIDSFSHEWEGLGGVTHAAEEAGGEFWHWKGPKIAHRRLVDKIQQSKIHIIVTLRTKQEYAVIPGGGKNGKNAIEKLGMKPVQSNDLDYEFLIAFHLNEDHEVNVTKDNTGLFKGEEFQIEAKHGEMLRDWLVEGKEVKSVAEEKAEIEALLAEKRNWIREQCEANTKVAAKVTDIEMHPKINVRVEQMPMNVLDKTIEAVKAILGTPAQEAKQEEHKKEAVEVEVTTPEGEKSTTTMTEDEDVQDEAANNIDDELSQLIVVIRGLVEELKEHAIIKDTVKKYMNDMKKERYEQLTVKQAETLHNILVRKAKTIEGKSA